MSEDRDEPGGARGPAPEGFETVPGRDGEVVILRRGVGPSLPAWLLPRLEESLQEGGQRLGRGAVTQVHAPDGMFWLKKYRHGGALREVLPDLFFGTGRMLGDLAASERARTNGVPCAAVAGLILRRVVGPLWRGYLLTDEIVGAETLDSALAKADRESARRLAETAVRTVRDLHDSGVLHRDLNLRNLLVRDGVVHVIDLDGARIAPSPSPVQRFANLSRLDRSYVKIFRERGPLTHDDRRALLAVYSGGDDALLADFESRVDAHKRSLARHAWIWK